MRGTIGAGGARPTRTGTTARTTTFTLRRRPSSSNSRRSTFSKTRLPRRLTGITARALKRITPTSRRVPRRGSRFPPGHPRPGDTTKGSGELMARSASIVSVAAGLLMTACATVPTGPSVMVLPANGKSFEQFQADDAVCRQWSLQQTGMTTKQASVGNTVSGAAIGTAAGSPATGAAVGAGAGLLGGTAIGASAGSSSQDTVQRRYDMTYMQCMYAKGNQIPVSRGSLPTTYTSPPAPPAASAPPPPAPPANVPPPPAGTPPPPPAGTAR